MDQQSFLFQSLVYLTAAVILVPVAKKAGLGSVLGYLVAGILIGPAVLNLAGDQSTDIMHVAEFGVVMMLFVIGLELEPELLWKLRKPIIGLGGLQVLLTIIIITLIAMLLGLTWKPALAIGMILTPSSTAIVLQTLEEKGLLKTQAGQSSFSVLLFQDIAVIPMLSILSILTVSIPGETVDGGEGNFIAEQPAGIRAFVLLGAVAAIIVAGRYLVKPLLRLVAASRIREIFTATALLLVIAITVLMTMVGLSPALGSFLGGVVLANSEYRHELESDIEPFKGLLLGLFFIGVGASINFELIALKPLQLTALVSALLILKGSILFILGKFFRLSTDQNALFSIGLSQTGEFAFVLLSFSRQQQILSAAPSDMIMAGVAISMALTPLMFLINEKLIQPRFGTREKIIAPPDIIDEKNPVIIAGFGHFGNTIGRFLKAHNIGTTILDIDSDRVDFLRKFGFKVYYGDASRYDLLKAAGADHARIILITVDDVERRLVMVETIKKHFPNLQIMVRASTRNDAYDLMNAGMLNIYRETLDTSLKMGVDTMRKLGFRAYSAQRAAITFRKYDEWALKQLASIRDQKQYINTTREFIDEMERIIQNDSRMPGLVTDKGWDEEGLIRDAAQQD